MSRRCKQCGEVKDISDFYKNSKTITKDVYIRKECKECTLQNQQTHYNYSTKYNVVDVKNCVYLKEIRLFVTSQNRIFTLDDIKDHVRSNNDKFLNKVRTTIEFYEQSGLISYVPNYEGDELLFTNTKYFKQLWNGSEH